MSRSKTAVLQAFAHRVQEGEAENLFWSEEKGLSPKGEEETHCEAMHVPFMAHVSVNAFPKGWVGISLDVETPAEGMAKWQRES